MIAVDLGLNDFKEVLKTLMRFCSNALREMLRKFWMLFTLAKPFTLVHQKVDTLYFDIVVLQEQT